MLDNIKTYAAYSKDDTLRLESSSGAVFSLLACQILNRNGVVYGIVLSEDCRTAEYLRVDNWNDLSKLRGSKYLQAKIGNTYRQVKNELEAGIAVLFSGTSCCINGLKCFLGKEYDNLYCVDVICHGTPSPKLWKQYIDYVEQQQNAKLVSINFRCKDYGWIDFGIKQMDEQHKALYISKDKDPYMLMFLRDYCLRPSCYECAAKSVHKSDLTLADFWGIDDVVPEMNDGKGVSLIITRTDKGQNLFDSISREVSRKEVSYEAGVRNNPAEYSSAKRPEERKYFFDDMQKFSFDEMVKKYGLPPAVPMKRRIKKIILKMLLKTPARKLIGGHKPRIENYGMRFIFEEK